MGRVSEFIHNTKLVLAAVILFMAVLVYCLYHRYDYVQAGYNVNGGFVIDHLTGQIKSYRSRD